MTRLAMILTAWLVLAAAALAQMDMPKPAPEVKKLDALAGSWSLEGAVKPHPSNPGGGTVLENEKCEWMEGNFFLVCHVDFKGSMGTGSAISIMGYSTDDKAYTYREFNSWGEFTDSKGSVDGDTWTWVNDEKMNGEVMKGRFTMKNVTSASYTFSYEMSQDGKTWTNIMDGKATKQK